jgi:hypothetical protein
MFTNLPWPGGPPGGCSPAGPNLPTHPTRSRHGVLMNEIILIFKTNGVSRTFELGKAMTLPEDQPNDIAR